MPRVSDERQRSIYLSLNRNKLFSLLVASQIGAEMCAGVLVAVNLEAGGTRLAAMVTHESFRNLGVEAGRELVLTFKSSAVHCF